MANTVLLKKSSVASRVPTTSDLEYGELAINYADGKLYFKNSSNEIDSFLSTAASSTVSSVDGNTGDVTAQQLLDAILTVDGDSSSLDADRLDDEHGSFYLDYNNFTNIPTIPDAASLSVDDIITLTGVSEGDTDLGTFTGSTVSDNTTIKTALQELETAVEAASSASTDPQFDIVGRSGTVSALLQPILQLYMKFDDYTFRTQAASIIARSGTLTVTG